jgi:hypothetical protein
MSNLEPRPKSSRRCSLFSLPFLTVVYMGEAGTYSESAGQPVELDAPEQAVKQQL